MDLKFPIKVKIELEIFAHVNTEDLASKSDEWSDLPLVDRINAEQELLSVKWEKNQLGAFCCITF